MELSIYINDSPNFPWVEILVSIAAIFASLGLVYYARVQVKLTTIDHKLSVYDYTREFLLSISQPGKTAQENDRALMDYLWKVRHAKFVFFRSDGIDEYIQLLKSEALELSLKLSEYEGRIWDRTNEAERKLLNTQIVDKWRWFYAQNKVLDEKIKDTL